MAGALSSKMGNFFVEKSNDEQTPYLRTNMGNTCILIIHYDGLKPHLLD